VVGSLTLPAQTKPISRVIHLTLRAFLYHHSSTHTPPENSTISKLGFAYHIVPFIEMAPSMEIAIASRAAETFNHLNILIARAGHVTCSTDIHGVRHCKEESFFHRVGRWILTAFMIFFGLIALLILCCCIKRHRKKRAKKAAIAAPMQQVYAPPQSYYAPQPPQATGVVPPAPPVDSKPR